MRDDSSKIAHIDQGAASLTAYECSLSLVGTLDRGLVVSSRGSFISAAESILRIHLL